MRRETERKHNIDILFQMVVFLLFTFSAILLLLLAVNFYRSTVEKSERNQSARVAVSYIREVIHQNDEQGGISLTQFDGVPCIRLKQAEDYVLYLYLKEGELRELYTKEGAQVSSADGQRIMQLRQLDCSMLRPELLLIECEDIQGNREQVLISLRSTAGGDAS